ncbi:hypothetical protein ACFP56_10295 [Paenibacillus septentrionalis]|uniref:Uncharacterized protein n=1 Tax=Paenibacillus septentrionalis TaxID=429342 RepID=A0ABW1V3E6_9BACL
MKLNVRLLVESLIVAFVLMAIFFIWQIVQGYFLTKKIVHSFDSTMAVDHAFPSNVVITSSNSGLNWSVSVAVFLLMAVVYYGIRYLFIHYKRSK